MCDMRQFVVVAPTSDEFSATLVFYFMQHVLLKFGMCYLVLLDDGAILKSVFIAICEALNLDHDVLAKHKDKGLTVDHIQIAFLTKLLSEQLRMDSLLFIETNVSSMELFKGSK